MQKNGQKGAILLFVVIIVAIIGILYTSIYTLINSERKIHQTVEYRMKAYYIAESGIERAAAIIKASDDEDIPEELPALDNPFAEQYTEEHRIEVTIEKNAPTYKITSRGKFKNTVRIIEEEIFKKDDTFNVQYWKEIN
ncbi:MAG: hypothetical protein ACM3KR_05120 [Deltaproteobacteria bacterium]